MSKRVFLIVLDSCGCGAMPDAHCFGDSDCHTIKRIAGSPYFRAENLCKMGLGNIEGLSFLGTTDNPTALTARLAERSEGKDTTVGHWEIAGLVSGHPLPTYPDGFPSELLDAFTRETGRGILCNKPYSGTDVIRDYGDEHLRTGKLIVYTSADSVFQIAAHEEAVPPERLYEYCRIARRLLCGEHAVGRVIARPFTGKYPFARTANRRDFSLQPPADTVLDAVRNAGKDVLSVGKIYDIFNGKGITDYVLTHSNAEGMEQALQMQKRDFNGLCFINLVDFDMLYGHRQDTDGYAKAFAAFDTWLPLFVSGMRSDDILMITADHGCDPGDSSTDHTREYTPLLVYGKSVTPGNAGTGDSFCDIAATIADYLDVPFDCPGQSLLQNEKLCSDAVGAMKKAYAPYSRYCVGAALRGKSGTVFTGCNIESASYTPTVCAERTALCKAVSEGERVFSVLAVAGGKDGTIEGAFPPCGVCRQMLAEFCRPDFRILVVDGTHSYRQYRLADLLPEAFTPEYLRD